MNKTISFAGHDYIVDIESDIKIGDHYGVTLFNPITRSHLENFMVFECLDEQSALFNSKSPIAVKIISTNDPKFKNICSTL